jgi:hypothetical protein
MATIQKKVLVCIFSIHDEKSALDILKRIPDSVIKCDHEILILIDGSRETEFHSATKTVKGFELLNIQILIIAEGLGHGGSQKLAFHYAIKQDFDLVIIIDGSGQYFPEDIEKLMSSLTGSDAQAVMGSRFLNRTKKMRSQMSFYRYLGNLAVSFLQNKILGLKFSEFHSSLRAFRVKSLEKIPFFFNSNGRQFDTEILIQLNLKNFHVIEIPISFIGRFRTKVLEYFMYGFDVVKLSIKFRLHMMSIFYERKFDVSSSVDKYTLKAGYPSSHQFTLNEVRKNSRVLDVGCGNSLVGSELMKLGCWVEAIDCENSKGLNRINKFTKMNLNDESENIPVHNFDYVLLLDVLEHLEEPEIFVWNLRTQAHGKRPNILVSVPNIGFFVMRLQLLFGRFNYGIKGILDMGHRRLFTFYTIRKMFEDAGFDVLKCKGIPAPYPEAIGKNMLSLSLLKINSLLIKIFPKLFSYQIFMVAAPLPTLDILLKNSKKK